MKRIHLFEFEDFSWFPKILRTYLTRYLMAVHKLLDSSTHISGLLSKLLISTGQSSIVDLCSGSGGPMIEVYQKAKGEFPDLKLTLTDLYPDISAGTKINQDNNPALQYHRQSVNAASVPSELTGVRTLICSFHHLSPGDAKKVLADAAGNRQPLFIYEISDNSFPKWLWWVAFPVNLITVLIITLTVRPLHWGQILLTYLIPILTVVIAWDGAVSNARTYTLKDLDMLLKDIESPDYHWKSGTIDGKGGPKIYLMGYPETDHSFQ